jgi:hypothetical protein
MASTGCNETYIADSGGGRGELLVWCFLLTQRVFWGEIQRRKEEIRVCSLVSRL